MLLFFVSPPAVKGSLSRIMASSSSSDDDEPRLKMATTRDRLFGDDSSDEDSKSIPEKEKEDNIEKADKSAESDADEDDDDEGPRLKRKRAFVDSDSESDSDVDDRRRVDRSRSRSRSRSRTRSPSVEKVFHSDDTSDPGLSDDEVVKRRDEEEIDDGMEPKVLSEFSCPVKKDCFKGHFVFFSRPEKVAKRTMANP